MRWAEVVRRPAVAVERAERDQCPAFTVGVLVAGVAAVAMGRFGLPPVNLHPPIHYYLGIMNPLCGMTRATAALGRGDLSTAWRFNPGVFVVAAAATTLLIRLIVAVLDGRWVWIRLRGWPFLLAATFVVVALEVNQQAHASVLR